MNEQKFDKKGKIYAKARPGYPRELFEHLIENNIISNDSTVADIGSGTGLFTMRLSPLVGKIFAVEPNSDMRRVAEEKYKEYNNIVSVDGTAEKTSLGEKSVDFVTVAQAFHWFDRQSFKAECQRILKPGNKILLVWNDRDTASELIKENYEINRRFCPDFKGSSNGIDFDREAFTDFFEGDFEVVNFRNDLIYNLDAFVARCLSSSYAPKQGDASYEPYVRALEELFGRYKADGTVPYPYITRCYIGNV